MLYDVFILGLEDTIGDEIAQIPFAAEVDNANGTYFPSMKALDSVIQYQVSKACEVSSYTIKSREGLMLGRSNFDGVKCLQPGDTLNIMNVSLAIS